MVSMKEDFKELMRVLRKAGDFSRLEFVYFFGSRPEGKARKDSDLDICLYYNIKDQERLRKMLYRIKGSLPERMDVSMFQLLPLQVRKDVFKGRLAYGRRRGFVYDVAKNTIDDYRLFEPIYNFSVMNTPSHPRRFRL